MIRETKYLDESISAARYSMPRIVARVSALRIDKHSRFQALAPSIALNTVTVCSESRCEFTIRITRPALFFPRYDARGCNVRVCLRYWTSLSAPVFSTCSAARDRCTCSNPFSRAYHRRSLRISPRLSALSFSRHRINRRLRAREYRQKERRKKRREKRNVRGDGV